MLKQLKFVGTMGALALVIAATSPAIGASAAPSGASETAGDQAQAEFAGRFWTTRRMKAMDTNKDGMVSRDEYMDYVGKQYDMMDTGKKKMLDSKAFTDKKMMSKTFPVLTE